MSNNKKMRKSTIIKKIKDQTILDFLMKHDKSTEFVYDDKNKIKYTSSDSFGKAVEALANEYKDVSYPTIAANVSGFYEVATLAGLMEGTCRKRTKPSVLFFDRNINNIQNAIFNTLLISMSNNKEELLTDLFALDNVDIVKAFEPKIYDKLCEKVITENEQFKNTTPTEKELDAYLENNYISKDVVSVILNESFTIKKLKTFLLEKKYSLSNSYDYEAHNKALLEKAKKHLKGDMLSLFENVSENICKSLSEENRFIEFTEYLFKDIERNKDIHIYDNEDVFNGYKNLISKNGTGNIKFLRDIDISTPKGIEELEKILISENIISNNLDSNTFPIDIMAIPHIRRFEEAQKFVKQNSQFVFEVERDHKNKESGIWSFSPAFSLQTQKNDENTPSFNDNLKNCENRFANQAPLEDLGGMPPFTIISGPQFGSKYTDKEAVLDAIATAVHQKVKLVIGRGMIYPTHGRQKTALRRLEDGEFPSLDSRYSVTKSIGDYLNEKGIDFLYQTGVEEADLARELFYRMYFQELKETSNFLSRSDVEEKYDYLKEGINEAIIYMIRAGKDITYTYDNNGFKVSRVFDIANYFYARKNNLPIGKYSYLVDEGIIEKKYLNDSNKFRIISEELYSFDKNNDRLSVDIISNLTFSDISYKNADYAAIEYASNQITGAIKEGANNAQIISDSHQALMQAKIVGSGKDAKLVLNTPQMIRDEWYHKKGLIPVDVKKAQSCKTYSRITQTGKRMNFPGNWTIQGDLDQILRIYPSWGRTNEIKNYVQKTGVPLEKKVEGTITDIQLGSITERAEYYAKFLDIMFYKYGSNIISYMGDLQQGYNYKSYHEESRHTAAHSVGQQRLDFSKLQRPWLENAFGVIPPKIFELHDESNKMDIDQEKSLKILECLEERGIVEKRITDYNMTYAIKSGVNYKMDNLFLPDCFKQYEAHIREKLNTVFLVEMISLVEGNHEKNTDWNHKGYKLTEELKVELETLRNLMGANTDIQFSEYIVNSQGDFVEGSYCYSEINGYRTLTAHNFRSPVKGGGGSPTESMAKVIESLGSEYRNIDVVEQGHLHNFEARVINDRLYIVYPGMAGQSGFEQRLGYSSHPGGLMKIIDSNGDYILDYISSNFIRNWTIKNPKIKEIGLEKHIQNSFTQKAGVIGSEKPDILFPPKPRVLIAADPVKRIGPKIK